MQKENEKQLNVEEKIENAEQEPLFEEFPEEELEEEKEKGNSVQEEQFDYGIVIIPQTENTIQLVEPVQQIQRKANDLAKPIVIRKQQPYQQLQQQHTSSSSLITNNDDDDNGNGNVTNNYNHQYEQQIDDVITSNVQDYIGNPENDDHAVNDSKKMDSKKRLFGSTQFEKDEEELINRLLAKRIPPTHLANRNNGKMGNVQYIEGWKANELANAVFGFNGWKTHILSLNVDSNRYINGKFHVSASCVMEITLKDGTVREDVGNGARADASEGSAIEQAKKEAVTDATKRTLRNFGNLLGNCTYDKTYLNSIKGNIGKVATAHFSYDQLRTQALETLFMLDHLENPQTQAPQQQQYNYKGNQSNVTQRRQQQQQQQQKKNVTPNIPPRKPQTWNNYPPPQQKLVQPATNVAAVATTTANTNTKIYGPTVTLKQPLPTVTYQKDPTTPVTKKL